MLCDSTSHIEGFESRDGQEHVMNAPDSAPQTVSAIFLVSGFEAVGKGKPTCLCQQRWPRQLSVPKAVIFEAVEVMAMN